MCVSNTTNGARHDDDHHERNAKKEGRRRAKNRSVQHKQQQHVSRSLTLALIPSSTVERTSRVFIITAILELQKGTNREMCDWSIKIKNLNVEENLASERQKEFFIFFNFLHFLFQSTERKNKERKEKVCKKISREDTKRIFKKKKIKRKWELSLTWFLWINRINKRHHCGLPTAYRLPKFYFAEER